MSYNSRDYAENAIRIGESVITKETSIDDAYSELTALADKAYNEAEHYRVYSEHEGYRENALSVFLGISSLIRAVTNDNSAEIQKEINSLKEIIPEQEEGIIGLFKKYWWAMCIGLLGGIISSIIRSKRGSENRKVKREREAIAMAVSYTDSIEEYQDYIDNMDGWQFEKFAADWLRFKGWQKVEVTPGSGDFGADIIAYSPDGERYAIQCKKYDKPVGVKAVQEVVAAQIHYCCEGAAVISTTRYTPAAQQLADECDVLLMNIP